MNTFTFDIECLDHGIQADAGPGFPWHGYQFIGMAHTAGDTIVYCTDEKECLARVRQAIDRGDTLVAHNAQYEAGWLRANGVDMRRCKIHCTKLMGKFMNNMQDTELGELGQNYLGIAKGTDNLWKELDRIGIIRVAPDFVVPNDSMSEKVRKRMQTLYSRYMNEVWAKLDYIAEAGEVVKKYCIRDVEITDRLYRLWQQSMSVDYFNMYDEFCLLINATTESRHRGIRVDIPGTYKVWNHLRRELVPLELKFWAEYGYMNLNSPTQMSAYFKRHKYEPKPDLHGKPSYGANFIKAYANDERVQLYGKIRHFGKYISFCESIIRLEKNGRVYPEMVIMEARTGRFSSRNPNIQQIPKRDEELGPMLRGLFLPEAGERWLSLDYSSQEPRLQVHYGVAIGDRSAIKLAEEYKNNPTLDLHKRVGDEMGVKKAEAKTINLGLSYMMGLDKLAAQLGVAVEHAETLKNRYLSMFPYLRSISKYAEKKMKERGFIFTLGRRKSVNEPGW